MLDNLWAIFQLILGFSVLIVIHELGHLLVAKWVGVRCTAFSLGMGVAGNVPPILAYRKGMGLRFFQWTEPEANRRIDAYLREQGIVPTKPVRDEQAKSGVRYEYSPSEQDKARAALGLGETEYRWMLLPLGGYVAMVGQDDMDPTVTSDDPRSFGRKPIRHRMAIISAGVVMNAILAVILFIFAFRMGVEFPPATVGFAAPDTPAAKTPAEEDPTAIGLLPGDRIVEIDDHVPTNFTSVLIAAPLGSRDTPIRFVVERPSLDGGEARRLTYMLTPHARDHRNDLPYVGIAPPSTLEIAREDEVAPGVADKLAADGLRPGMRITAIDGHGVDEYWQLDRRVQASRGRDVGITYTAGDGQSKTLKVTPTPVLDVAAVQPLPAESPKLTVDLPHLLGLVPPTQVESVLPGRPAEKLLSPGDTIVRIGKHDWPAVGTTIDLISNSDDEPLAFTVLRNGETVETTLKPDGGKVGAALRFATESTTIARVLPDTPFAKLDIPAGSRVTHVAGNSVASFADLRLALEAAGPGEVDVTLEHASFDKPSVQKLSLSPEQHAAVARLRWAIDTPFLRPYVVEQKAATIGEAVALGVKNTHVFMMQTYVTLMRLVQGWLHLDNMRGPVGIVGEGIHVVERGFPYILFFFGLISINLAVINFLPLPIVDGGLAVLLILEKLRGKPLPPQIANTINLVGLLLIGTLFITLTYMDIARLVTGS